MIRVIAAVFVAGILSQSAAAGEGGRGCGFGKSASYKSDLTASYEVKKPAQSEAMSTFDPKAPAIFVDSTEKVGETADTDAKKKIDE